MPYNPAGIFSLIASYLAVPGEPIKTEQHNPVFEDVAGALSQVLVRDGRAPMSGPLNMNGFQINNVVAGSSPNSVATLAQGIPIGAWIDYPGDTAPAGWMLCFGQALSRTAYPELFTAIGTKFGAGDGSTTFNLPDLRGRISLGKDNMGGTSAGRLTTANFGSDPTVIGNAGGGEKITMQYNNMPYHAHSVYLYDPGHVHNFQFGLRLTPNGIAGAVPGIAQPLSANTDPAVTNMSIWSNGPGSGTQNQTAPAGQSTPDPIRTVPPSVITNKIIRVSYDV